MEILHFPCGERQGWLLPCGNEPAPLAVLLAGSLEEQEIAHLASLFPSGLPMHLCSFSPVNWDRDYPPWPLKTPERSFYPGADRLGLFLRQELLPEVENRCAVTQRAAVGYSLGGLAALYLTCQENSPFSACASCSGSLWFPGFTGWLSGQSFPRCVYLSVGGKEKNIPDPMMSQIEDKTQETFHLLKKTRVTFVREHGGHFADIPGRITRAISWLSAAMKENS